MRNSNLVRSVLRSYHIATTDASLGYTCTHIRYGTTAGNNGFLLIFPNGIEVVHIATTDATSAVSLQGVTRYSLGSPSGINYIFVAVESVSASSYYNMRIKIAMTSIYFVFDIVPIPTIEASMSVFYTVA